MPNFFFGALLLWFGIEISRDWLLLSFTKMTRTGACSPRCTVSPTPPHPTPFKPACVDTRVTAKNGTVMHRTVLHACSLRPSDLKASLT